MLLRSLLRPVHHTAPPLAASDPLPLPSLCPQHAKLCGTVANATQTCGAKLLLTLSAMTLTFTVALMAVDTSY